MSKFTVRLIFSRCVQDGAEHWTQMYTTIDVPIPEDIANSHKFDTEMKFANLYGAELIHNTPEVG